MKADEIRKKYVPGDYGDILREIAAQIAELNETMREQAKGEKFRSTFERVFG